ncbi:hypothetical protein VPFG_00096 [Vibrio phage nt-1]|uniref:Uncharacterized protein n=1 Tax=Vibrio phage nt-1 TaxID=115992 RepID=R9TG81_9CAUD|nr:hypothetical protein VPFG_00096 [Vibrio phage nt-1]AGN30098.1 hypothetical protein VPFG_00096 [Vibrio phage nt-1]
MFDAASVRGNYHRKQSPEHQKDINELQDFLFNTLMTIDKISKTELESNFGVPAKFYEIVVDELENLGYHVRAVQDTYHLDNMLDLRKPSKFEYITYKSHEDAVRHVNSVLRAGDNTRMILTRISWRRA